MTTLICTISCYRDHVAYKSKIIAIGPLKKKSATGKHKYCNLNIYVCIYSIHIYYIYVYSMHILYTKYCKYTYTHAYTIYELII